MIFYIYGTDAYLCRQKLDEIRDGFVEKKDKGGLNVVRLDAANLSLELLKQEALTVPFLSEKKMIIIDGLISQTPTAAGKKKLRDETAEFLSAQAEHLENNLVFYDVFEDEKKLPKKDELFDFLRKQKYSWQLLTPGLRDLGSWIANYAKSKNLPIAPQAINELIATVGSDTTQLANELAKLKAFTNGQAVTASDVQSLVKAKIDSDAFALTDALASRNRQLALELLSHQLQAGEEPLSILGSINWQFKTLYKIADALRAEPRANAAALAGQLGLHPYVVTKNMAAAKRFSAAELAKILNQLLDIERQLKTGHKNPELLLDLFIAKICQ